MEVIYDGKTNRLVKKDDKLLLEFKDTILGDEHRAVDPGGNFVVGRVPGKGVASAAVTTRIFEVLKEAAVPSHFIRRHSDTELEIKKAEPIRLEVVYRVLAYGSFLKRYRTCVKPLSKLDIVEFNVKDDVLGDPLIAPEVIPKLKIASAKEVENMEKFAKKISKQVSKYLAGFGLKLVDMKVEFGRIGQKLTIIDSLSGDTMRVLDSKKNKILDQIALAKKLKLIKEK